ncbi:hypothetical protein D3C72_2440550 [compost metagenome]
MVLAFGGTEQPVAGLAQLALDGRERAGDEIGRLAEFGVDEGLEQGRNYGRHPRHYAAMAKTGSSGNAP